MVGIVKAVQSYIESIPADSYTAISLTLIPVVDAIYLSVKFVEIERDNPSQTLVNLANQTTPEITKLDANSSRTPEESIDYYQRRIALSNDVLPKKNAIYKKIADLSHRSAFAARFEHAFFQLGMYSVLLKVISITHPIFISLIVVSCVYNSFFLDPRIQELEEKVRERARGVGIKHPHVRTLTNHLEEAQHDKSARDHNLSELKRMEQELAAMDPSDSKRPGLTRSIAALRREVGIK